MNFSVEQLHLPYSLAFFSPLNVTSDVEIICCTKTFSLRTSVFCTPPIKIPGARKVTIKPV